MKPMFIVSCPIDTYSGYGARARDFVKALIELDEYDVKVLPQRWGETPWGFIEAHPDPLMAKCDGPCALPLDKLEPYLVQMKALDELVKGFEPLITG